MKETKIKYTISLGFFALALVFMYAECSVLSLISWMAALISFMIILRDDDQFLL